MSDPSALTNKELAALFSHTRLEICARFQRACDQTFPDASAGIESENGYSVTKIYGVDDGKLQTSDGEFGAERFDVNDLAAILHQLKS